MPYRQARFTQEEVQRLLRAAKAEDCIVRFGELVIEPRDGTTSRTANDNHDLTEDEAADARWRALDEDEED